MINIQTVKLDNTNLFEESVQKFTSPIIFFTFYRNRIKHLKPKIQEDKERQQTNPTFQIQNPKKSNKFIYLINYLYSNFFFSKKVILFAQIPHCFFLLFLFIFSPIILFCVQTHRYSLSSLPNSDPVPTPP